MLPLLAAMALGITAPTLVRVPITASFPDSSGETVMTAKVEAGISYDEAIVSWNVEPGAGAAIRVEVKPPTSDKWYVMAIWSPDRNQAPRESVSGQKDDVATVLTDTLRLAKPATSLDLRITLTTLAPGEKPRLKLLTVAFSFGPAALEDLTPTENSSVYGKTIDVVEKAQGDYPRGAVVCSPTSLAMVLDFWAREKKRPDWAKDVPEVDEAVFDPVYNGSGNWTFNTAYAGSLPDLSAYVARLSSIKDIEDLVAKGIPPICSAPFRLLQGREAGKVEDGHLVVVVDFTPDGQVLVNDPGKRGETRRICTRENFDKAWRTSKRTVYIVQPE